MCKISIPLKFSDEDKAKEIMYFKEEMDEMLFSENLLERLNKLGASVRVIGGNPVYDVLPIIDIIKQLYADLNNNPNPKSVDYKEPQNGYMKKFRTMHKKFNISTDLIKQYLYRNGKDCVTVEDRDFLYFFFKDFSPQGTNQKTYKHGVDSSTVENMLWQAEGLYKIYLHMGADEETLKEIENRIEEKTDFSAWKVRAIGIRIIEQIQIRIDRFTNGDDKTNKQKWSEMLEFEQKMIEALEEK